MRKLIKGILISVFCFMSVCSSVYADKMSNSGSAANPITGRMNIVGTVDGEEAARTATIFILKPDAKLENNNNSLYENCLYVNSADVDFDGSYEFEFDFKPNVAPDSVLPVYVVCGENIYGYTYSYKTWEEIKELFEYIRQGTVQYSQLEKYFDTFGIDFSKYDNEKYKEGLIKKVNKLSKITDDENGIAMLKKCVGDTKIEFDLLSELPSQSNWTDIKNKIAEIEKYFEVEFSYKNSDSEKVCKALLTQLKNGKMFYSVDELKTEFDKLAANNPKDTGTPSQSGGTVTGGGGVRNSVNPYVENPNTKFEDGKLVQKISFDDLLQTHWAYGAVDYLYQKGFVRGVSEKSYEPDRAVKREEFVKMAVSAFEIYNAELKADFIDTDKDEWYSSYIASAKSNGLVNGVSDAEFGLGENIKRQDMAVIIYNGLQKKGYKFSDKKVEFSDFDLIDDYAKTAVSSLAASGIINGMDNGCFNPHDNATRAQAAQMIYIMLRSEGI